jgi:uroporphyrinogen-III synthase
LRARGALVIELVCYQRHRRRLEAQIRLRLQSLMRESAISAWVIGSTETLDSLLENMVVAKGTSIADQAIVKSDLANQQLLVPHARIAAAATASGFRRVAITSLHPKAVLATLNATGTQDLS